MDKDEFWQQFWGSGKIEDYLSYSMCEREEHTKQEQAEEADRDFRKKEKDYFL